MDRPICYGSDRLIRYCSQRRDLEERTWNLIERLSVLTHKLMRSIGTDHGDFMAIKVLCAGVKEEICASRNSLAEHRTAHGC